MQFRGVEIWEMAFSFVFLLNRRGILCSKLSLEAHETDFSQLGESWISEARHRARFISQANSFIASFCPGILSHSAVKVPPAGATFILLSCLCKWTSPHRTNASQGGQLIMMVLLLALHSVYDTQGYRKRLLNCPYSHPCATVIPIVLMEKVKTAAKSLEDGSVGRTLAGQPHGPHCQSSAPCKRQAHL